MNTENSFDETFRSSLMPPGGSYIDGVEDFWRWMRDEGYGVEKRVSLLLLQLTVPY